MSFEITYNKDGQPKKVSHFLFYRLVDKSSSLDKKKVKIAMEELRKKIEGDKASPELPMHDMILQKNLRLLLIEVGDLNTLSR